jgi:hypothetical protein
MLFAGFASAESAIVGIGSGYGSVTIPISVTNGTNVGSIHVNLIFNPEIVTVTSVTNGNMDSMMPNLEHTKDGHVQIIAYQASNPGLNGNFNVAQVTFKSIDSSGSCPLGITVITFKDSTPTGNVMAYTVSNGTYTATSSGGGGGGDGTYPPDPTPTITPTTIPTTTPTITPTTSPTPSPTKTLPHDDDEDMTALGRIVMAIIALLIAAGVIISRIMESNTHHNHLHHCNGSIPEWMSQYDRHRRRLQ